MNEISVGIIGCLFMCYSFYMIDIMRLDECEKTNNVYQCEWVAVPKKVESNE
jgi:hypothetical protein